MSYARIAWAAFGAVGALHLKEAGELSLSIDA